jgi:hypothetical protein
MSRNLNSKYLLNHAVLQEAGISVPVIEAACNYTHAILDLLDEKLVTSGASPISELIELANLSSMVGNLLGAGIVKFSNGMFQRNGPHKYPDLLSQNTIAKDIEIKVALECNKPKGHLAKAGYYLICRYVLVSAAGQLDMNHRGDKVAIWEIRFGFLALTHFNLSNTAGDSGKTAVVNNDGMNALKVIYCDLDKCPYPKTGKIFKQYQSLFNILDF